LASITANKERGMLRIDPTQADSYSETGTPAVIRGRGFPLRHRHRALLPHAGNCIGTMAFTLQKAGVRVLKLE
jgi:hypothetical protein